MPVHALSMVDTSDWGSSVLIPVEGLMHVFTYDLDPSMALGHFGARGVLVCMGLDLTVGKVVLAAQPHDSRIWFHAADGLPVNDRARRALVHLIGAHMIFTGPVVFTGLPEGAAFEVVKELSREEELPRPNLT